MKKKRLYLTAFLWFWHWLCRVESFPVSSVPVQAAATSKNADRICEKKSEVGTITIRTEKKLPAGTKVLQEISTISERQVQPNPEF